MTSYKFGFIFINTVYALQEWTIYNKIWMFMAEIHIVTEASEVWITHMQNDAWQDTFLEYVMLIGCIETREMHARVWSSAMLPVHTNGFKV